MGDILGSRRLDIGDSYMYIYIFFKDRTYWTFDVLIDTFDL